MNYYDFIKNKIAVAPVSGFAIDPVAVHPMLKPHQRDCVVWAIYGGRRALFEAPGLGKTFQQLEICRLITLKQGGRAMVICPLGVKQEFANDAGKLGLKTQYVRTDAEIAAVAPDVICITNYERVRNGNIDVAQFTVICLDEAAILRDFGSETYQTFLVKFQAVQYRFVATATPSPNRFKELIHYAAFLGIMDSGQALTRFFQRDSEKAGNLTLHPHKEKEFWLWVSTWAVFLSKPSDLGYDDTGYDLPKLTINWHCLPIDHRLANADRDGQGRLLRNAALGVQEAAMEKRLTLDDRIAKTAEIIAAAPEDHFVLWHDLEAERHAIKVAIPEATEVYGSLDLETREQRVIDFSAGRLKYLATKPQISGCGCNFQYHCHRAIFAGIGFEFHDFYQAIHRLLRFQQPHEVIIDIIYAESETEVVEILRRKWRQHDELIANMTAIMKQYGLFGRSALDTMARTIGVTRQEIKGERFTAVNNDCVLETMQMPENSVDLIVTSIPFSNHYEYTPTYEDFGHNSGNNTFFAQMDYLSPELLRILKPGRVAAIHVKDRIQFGSVTGYGMPSLDPFHAETIFHYRKHGFIFFGMITIETDVVRENNQTYRLGWTENCKDGSKMGVGCPEYMLLFRKLPTDRSKAYADIKVEKSKADYPRGRWQIDARAKYNSSGNRFLTPEEISGLGIDVINRHYSDIMRNRVYDYHDHLAISAMMEQSDRLPADFETLKVPARNEDVVWSDVSRMRTLNVEQSKRNLENHICPLQYDIVERIINRYSNPGELVFDPFGGVMTVPYMAIKMGRRGYACELNQNYWRDGVEYCRREEDKLAVPDLFSVAL